MKKNKLTDAELLRRYTRGDEQSLNVLIERYRLKLFGYIFNKVKHHDLAEDIFQDTFIKVINSVKSGKNYTEEGKFGSWLMRIAHNQIIDHFRKQKKRQLTYDTEEFSMFDILPDNNHAEMQIIREQTVEKIRQLIEELPPEQKRVLKLRIYENVPFKDIADMMDISINTALGRMRYALINLRKLIRKYNIDFTA